MAKLIAASNMTLDGFCDHTAVNPDEEVHEHYSDLIRNAGLLLYGRITYQLMENWWPGIAKNPTGNKAIDEFAVLIDNVPKVVYSRTLQTADWKNTILKRDVIREEILELKHRADKDIYAGSPGLIVTLAKLQLIDEYQLCVHPVIVGKGLPLFKSIEERIDLTLLNTKIFRSGAAISYYQPVDK